MKLKNEENHVMILRAVWVKFASELAGKRVFVKKVKKGGVQWEMCNKIINFCWEMAISPEEYIFTINSLYSKDWIKHQFNQIYLPFNIIISQKNFERAQELFYTEVKESNKNYMEDVENYINLLKDTPKDVALELIKCGFCGTDSQVLYELNKAINRRTEGAI